MKLFATLGTAMLSCVMLLMNASPDDDGERFKPPGVQPLPADTDRVVSPTPIGNEDTPEIHLQPEPLQPEPLQPEPSIDDIQGDAIADPDKPAPGVIEAPILVEGLKRALQGRQVPPVDAYADDGVMNALERIEDALAGLKLGQAKIIEKIDKVLLAVDYKDSDGNARRAAMSVGPDGKGSVELPAGSEVVAVGNLPVSPYASAGPVSPYSSGPVSPYSTVMQSGGGSHGGSTASVRMQSSQPMQSQYSGGSNGGSTNDDRIVSPFNASHSAGVPVASPVATYEVPTVQTTYAIPQGVVVQTSGQAGTVVSADLSGSNCYTGADGRTYCTPNGAKRQTSYSAGGGLFSGIRSRAQARRGRRK